MQSLLRAIHWVESGVLVLLLSAMIGVAAYQVGMRLLYDSGLLWGEALVRVLVLWVALFGAMVASRTDDHIRIDLLRKLLPEKYLGAVKRLTNAFTAGVLGVFAWYAWQFVQFEMEDGTIAFASIPAWVCELVMPFAAAVMALRYLVMTVKPR